MLLMFISGVIFCLIVYMLWDKYGKAPLEAFLNKKFVKPIDDDNNKIVYDDWLERIANCNDEDVLREWQFADHGDQIWLWECGIDGEDALWYVCHDRRMEIYATREDEKDQRKINNKNWLIEG